MTAPIAVDRVLVSVVIPMLNEGEHIHECLDSFEAQDIGTDRLEVLVVDGGSTDGCRESVAERAGAQHWLRLLDNPMGRASAGFNVGAEAATGDVICIFSSHGVPSPSYARSSVEALAASGADGVGGRYLHVGTDPVSNAIGLAMVSPFGMASPHRFATAPQEVDTISHPAYLAASLRKVLPFDETLMRNSDYELNWRMRAAGMKLWFDPSIESVYRPRPDLRALGRQFWWYGRWKVRVMRRHPDSFRPRHLAGPSMAVFVGASPLICRSRAGRSLTAILAAAYASGVTAAAIHSRPKRHGASIPAFAAALPTMHLCWGGGFLASAVDDLIRGMPDE